MTIFSRIGPSKYTSVSTGLPFEKDTIIIWLHCMGARGRYFTLNLV